MSEDSCQPEKSDNESVEDSEGEEVGPTVMIRKRGKLEETSGSSSEDEKDESMKEPAWVDEGDVYTCQEVVEIQGRKVDFGSAAGNDYKKSLEKKFESVVGAPKWARKRMKEDDESIKTGSLVSKSSALAKNILEYQKVKDLNRETYGEGHKVTSVLFHPTSTVGLVAGISGMVSLFQVDGKTNAKLQSIQFRKYPVHSAGFLKNGQQFIIGSSYCHYFYTHDLISGQSSQVGNLRISEITNTKTFRVSPDGKMILLVGKYGNIHVISAATKEVIATLKMNSHVKAIDMIGDDWLYSTGGEGQVYVWDMRTRQCVHKFIDDGCLEGTAIACSPNGNLLACGSNTGVVNIYDVNTVRKSSSPAPLKTVMNMVTQINCLKFNPASEILCMTSHEKDNAIKMLHCPSMTVFSNFPPFQAKFHRPQFVDFSPNGGYMAFSDNNKTAHLIRLKYYGNY